MYLKYENEELVVKELNNIIKGILIVIGVIVFTLTLFIGFYLFYTLFIETELFLSKIALYKYLKKNNHPIKVHILDYVKEYSIKVRTDKVKSDKVKSDKVKSDKVKSDKEYSINDKSDKSNEISLNHWLYNDSFSVHFDDGKCISVSWGNSPIDKRFNKRILDILKSPEYSKYSDDAVILDQKKFNHVDNSL